MHPLLFRSSQSGLFGWISPSDEIILPPRFHDLGTLENGLALVRVEADDETGFINAIGETVILPAFYDAENFTEHGLAAAVMGKSFDRYVIA